VELPDSRATFLNEQFRAVDKDSGQPLADLPYQIELPDGSLLRGTTDSEGRTERIAGADPASIKVVWGHRVGDNTAFDPDSGVEAIAEPTAAPGVEPTKEC
jgi:hypothetical protein